LFPNFTWDVLRMFWRISWMRCVFGQPCWWAVARLSTSKRWGFFFAALPCPPHGEYAARWCLNPMASHWVICFVPFPFFTSYFFLASHEVVTKGVNFIMAFRASRKGHRFGKEWEGKPKAPRLRKSISKRMILRARVEMAGNQADANGPLVLQSHVIDPSCYECWQAGPFVPPTLAPTTKLAWQKNESTVTM